MPPLVLSREQVRDVDRRAIEEFGLTGLVLMENAGRGCAELLLQRQPVGRIVICCGKGNNGGDGYVIARHLDMAGIDVQILLLTDPAELKGDARANFEIAQRLGLPIEPPEGRAVAALCHHWAQHFAHADWIVDCLLGTGTQGTIAEPYRSAIETINRSGRPVLAVDLPSGLDCDTGEPLGVCIKAAMTATFVALKPGFLKPVARPLLGDVEVVPIGIPPARLGLR